MTSAKKRQFCFALNVLNGKKDEKQEVVVLVGDV